MDKVTCPLLLIHGQKDKLIPFSHSIELSQKTSGPYEVVLPEEMDHNSFDLYEDFLEPIEGFLKRHSLSKSCSNKIIEIGKKLFEIPEYILDPINRSKNKDAFSSILRRFLNI
jgi:fermentation-respiration switch protein FrsA (DUF1100 family)